MKAFCWEFTATNVGALDAHLYDSVGSTDQAFDGRSNAHTFSKTALALPYSSVCGN